MQLQPTPSQSGIFGLSQEDVHRLLTEKTAEPRVDMSDRIGGAYSLRRYSDREMMVAEQVFRLLMRDTETRVRATLAENVKNSDRIPRDIVLTMARDVEEVALPVLQCSDVLTDDDLLQLIQSTDEVSRYLAISKRSRVSDTVTDRLLDKGHVQVTEALVQNAGAVISEAGFDKIMEQNKGNEAMMEAISARSYLPVATVEKLVRSVSASLGETLKAKYKQVFAPIDHEVEKTQEKETLGLISLAKHDADIDKLIAQLQATGKLTPSIILSALCQGDFNFFETALAKLSHIPVANARKLITDRGELGFRAIYNKSGLPDAMFPAVKMLLRIVRELAEEGERQGTPRYANRVVERILQYSENSDMGNLSYIIALVRRAIKH